MQNIIESILSQLSGNFARPRVSEVILKVGFLEVHSEAAARQAFRVLAKGTPLEDSRLTLTVILPVCECPACGHRAPFAIEGHHHHLPLPVAECPQCGAPAVLNGGRGVEAIDLVLADAGETV